MVVAKRIPLYGEGRHPVATSPSNALPAMFYVPSVPDIPFDSNDIEQAFSGPPARTRAGTSRCRARGHDRGRRSPRIHRHAPDKRDRPRQRPGQAACLPRLVHGRRRRMRMPITAAGAAVGAGAAAAGATPWPPPTPRLLPRRQSQADAALHADRPRAAGTVAPRRTATVAGPPCHDIRILFPPPPAPAWRRGAPHRRVSSRDMDAYWLCTCDRRRVRSVLLFGPAEERRHHLFAVGVGKAVAPCEQLYAQARLQIGVAAVVDGQL